MIVRNDLGLSGEQVRRNILLTRKMPLTAKALIIFILETKPDDYELNIHDLCLEHSCGIAALESVINSLQKFGYIDYEIINDGGKIDGKFTIYETPHDVTMYRYSYKAELKRKLKRADLDFIKKYLTSNKHQKRTKKISSLLFEMQNFSGVNWDNIYEWITMEMIYGEFIETEYWQIIAQYVKIQAKFTCKDCGKQIKIFSKLNTHHLTYENHGREHLPEVYENDLVCLCEGCHLKRHLADTGLHAPEPEFHYHEPNEEIG